MNETYFDSHCHLADKRFATDRDAVIQRAWQADVKQMLVVGTDVEQSKRAIRLASDHDGCYAAIGFSPHDASKATGSNLELLERLADDRSVVAIGETGLDYHYEFSPRDKQVGAMRDLLGLAKKRNLPVIFHLREAERDFLETINKSGLPSRGAVMHCFTSGEEMHRIAIDIGMYISFSGIATFRKSKDLRELIGKTPLEKLLIETDSPYLAPEPLRGKRCEPAMLVETARVCAEVLGLTVEDVARITRRNTLRLLDIPDQQPAALAYPIRHSLYLNITNECSNHCCFCVRQKKDSVKGHHLVLEREPSLAEMVVAIERYPLDDFGEVVFCGFGEPTMRMNLILELADYLKALGKRVRLNTNGQGNLINRTNIVPDLVGRIDAVSVSLIAADPETYQKVCRSDFGQDAWYGVVQFVQMCRAAEIATEVSTVNLPAIDLESCRRLASDLGAAFRVRNLV